MSERCAAFHAAEDAACCATRRDTARNARPSAGSWVTPRVQEHAWVPLIQTTGGCTRGCHCS